MAKFRKKVLIEAEQWFPGKSVAGVEALDGVVRIVTLEANDGFDYVQAGDWIATGSKGERWAIAPNIFVAIYEPAD